MGEKSLVLGDAPDETMCGYARDLIINYLYEVYEFEAFKNYKPLIDKILPPIDKTIENVLGIVSKKKYTSITEADIEVMRPDMDDMTNSIAKYFGITNYRPYQDNREIDDFMLNLPIEDKIYRVEYGKHILRRLAKKYLPTEIAWRKVKVGGIIYPVNTKRGWLDKGEFNKEKYLEYQKEILYGK
jgi:asparagine synthetase B (glutamine-hydrolysing)